MITKLSGLITYKYTMGFSVDGTEIPDPSSFSGVASDLDTLGHRDAKGYLHRNMVATKRKCEFEYRNIEWEMMQYIGDQFKNKSEFRFTYNDPFYGTTQINGYVGDRSWQTVWSPANGVRIGTLKFNIIEI